ncbi:MAG: hypothetical protein U5J64_12415 [Halobacteriales archaeon]|nr:hypothetical protein [Halobacteriales archaeon]
MDLKIDRVKVLYVVGVLLGLTAAFYFGFQLLEDLSPTTTSAVLILGFVVFFLAGIYVEAEVLDTVLYALGAGSYVVFVAYTLSVFDLGDGGVFVLLAGSSALFITLGYASSQGMLEVERRTALVAAAVVLVLGFALLGFDVTGEQPTHTAEFEDEVEVPPLPGGSTVGEVTIENPFVLSRTADVPRYDACLYAPDLRRTSIGYTESTFNLVIAGGESRTFNLVVGATLFYNRETGELRGELEEAETVPVETADECPDASDEVKIVVVPEGGPSSR